MKKFVLLCAAFVAALSVNAQLNNPIGDDGRYVVKYNCEQDKFAEANDFEVDEVVTIAVDVTGHWLENWLKATPTAPGATRGVAINNWTNYGNTNEAFRRFKQIKGNIYGLEMKLSDVMINEEKKGFALMTDSIVYVKAQIFGFEYTADNSGAGWWMWEGDVVETAADGTNELFATLPYTGTKTGGDIYGDDAPGMYEFTFKGYAAPCSHIVTAMEVVKDTKAAQKVIENGRLILVKDGVRFNALGARF